jgi:hypothetical protein
METEQFLLAFLHWVAFWFRSFELVTCFLSLLFPLESSLLLRDAKECEIH